MLIVIQCRYRPVLVNAVTDVFLKEQIGIKNIRDYKDPCNQFYFIRMEAEEYSNTLRLEMQLKQVLPPGAEIKINPPPEKKIIVMVTKEYHCLGDILMRNEFKTLGASVQCVIGNHAILQKICEKFGVPFHLVSHEEKNRILFEEELLEIIQQYEADYLVLAKFMRILSPHFADRFPMRIINIHHSFLPAFIGANPYKQAYHRGVKLIGATAHFVTTDLDEGPIIAQQTFPVNHSFTAADMIKTGKEIETAVLSKALQLVFDDRVFVYQNKTVIFD
jgi:formyltetrahydrofolate deformylase